MITVRSYLKKGCNIMEGVKIGKHHVNGLVCDGCFNIMLNYSLNIRQIVRDPSVAFESALEFMV